MIVSEISPMEHYRLQHKALRIKIEKLSAYLYMHKKDVTINPKFIDIQRILKQTYIDQNFLIINKPQ